MVPAIKALINELFAFRTYVKSNYDLLTNWQIRLDLLLAEASRESAIRHPPRVRRATGRHQTLDEAVSGA